MVDDKENILKLFARILGDAYEVTSAADGGRAISLIGGQEFDVIVTDLRMPGADGFEVLRAAKARSPETEVVMMTAYATVQDAVTAMKEGAYDYLQKPFDPDDATLVIARALERKRLRAQADALRRELEGVYSFHNLVGKSAPMKDVYQLLEQAAKLEITVLLNGETGTGKELAARAVHYHSARKERRFVPVNCGALPSELVESELFGHARGAFTGAVGAKAGLFEEAEGGTHLPRRDRRAAAAGPGEAQPGAPGAGDPPGRRQPAHPGRRAGDRGDPPRSQGRGRGGALPRGPLLSRERVPRGPPGAAGSPRGHPAPRHALPREARGRAPERHRGFEADALRALTGYPWPGQRARARERGRARRRGREGAEIELRDCRPT